MENAGWANGGVLSYELKWKELQSQLGPDTV